jgi:hypothetical protein
VQSNDVSHHESNANDTSSLFDSEQESKCDAVSARRHNNDGKSRAALSVHGNAENAPLSRLLTLPASPATLTKTAMLVDGQERSLVRDESIKRQQTSAVFLPLHHVLMSSRRPGRTH